MIVWKIPAKMEDGALILKMIIDVNVNLAIQEEIAVLIVHLTTRDIVLSTEPA
jgi:hypothetical protein